MFLPPPLKSSAAIRAASTEPIPLVSWKRPEMSFSTPMRTTLSDISAFADPQAKQASSTIVPLTRFITSSLNMIACADLGLSVRQAQLEPVKLGRYLDQAGQPAVR